MVHFAKYFKHYLYGTKTLIRTDHSALKWLMTFKQPEGQVARWLETLADFEFVIEHRAGQKHGNADGMSRSPCNQCGLQDEEESEIKLRVSAVNIENPTGETSEDEIF